MAAALAKARDAKRAKKAAAPEAGPVSKIVSIEDVKPDDVKLLLDQIKDLREQLATEKSERTREQQEALERAQAQGTLMQPGIEEVPSGKKVTVQKLDRYKTVGYENKRPVLEPIFKEVEVETYNYKIDMPPCGGFDLKINGMPLYHGSVVEVDIDTLRTIKDMIYRLWAHDSAIHGSDENAYRQKRGPVLRGARA